ncbi:hypothetical protein DFH94DRAFT_757904 [Russula ochroleuca]|jgi:hypothetical protein|uniref:Uncharacterized protein n=1 Tax=Russula ochroleuca TaxID=152965 RepID=A0A9P5MSB5_9AGAM|nr:hypothetical protein DFH94DRAFT_757904 [Russula ochroleuca]
MATPTQLPPPGLSSLTGPSPPSSSPTGPNPVGGNLPSLSLVLYVFAVILVLFLMILSVLVVRSVRRRRQRNAAFVAALASDSYGPSAALRGKHGGPESKPVLWETLITSVYDAGKGWAGLLPVAGVMPVPAHEAMSQHPASRQPRRRFPALGTRRPVAPDLPPTAPSLESPALSTGSMYLTVLVSMPTPLAHGKARQGRGPPVVELGVAQVTYTPNVS